MNQRRKAINHCMTTPYIWSTKGFNTDPLDQQTGVLPTKLSQSTTVIQGFKQTGVLSTKLSQSTTVIQGIKQKGVLQQSCLNQQQSFRVSNRQVFSNKAVSINNSHSGYQTDRCSTNKVVSINNSHSGYQISC